VAKKVNKKKTSEKPIMIFTLDTETRGLFGKIFRMGLYNGKDYWAFDQFEECYPLLKEFAETYEVHIYIHNLDFDLSKIAGTILPDIDLNKCIFIEHNVAVFSTSSIILHDSFKLLPSSLEKICKDFGLGEASKMDLTDHILNLGWAMDNNNKLTTDKDKINKSKSLGNYFENVSPHEPLLMNI
jgi:hypothetical protein